MLADLHPGASVRNILLSFLLVTAATRLHGQWRAALEGGVATAHGDARNDADPAHPEFHADRPATLTAALGRDVGRWRITVVARHTAADLTEVGGDLAVSTLGAFDAWGAGVEVAHGIAGHRPAPVLWAALTLGGDRWSLAGARGRWRSAVAGALEADVPLASAWSVVLRGEASASPSRFIASELPEGFRQHMTWTTGIGVGIARRL